MCCSGRLPGAKKVDRLLPRVYSKLPWDDWLTGGTLRELIPDWPRDPVADAFALRAAGALPALVLARCDPALAELSPPRSGAFDPIAGPEAVRSALRKHRAHLSDYLQRPPQTNEVGRSA